MARSLETPQCTIKKGCVSELGNVSIQLRAFLLTSLTHSMSSQANTYVPVIVSAILSSEPSGDGEKIYKMHIDTIQGERRNIPAFLIQKPEASQGSIFTVTVYAAGFSCLGPVSLQRSKIRFEEVSATVGLSRTAVIPRASRRGKIMLADTCRLQQGMAGSKRCWITSADRSGTTGLPIDMKT